MKKREIRQIINKQGNKYQIVFTDGTHIFWPNENMRGIEKGAYIIEHKHKNGQTVAFSCGKNIRFVVPQPYHFDDAIEFIEKFKLIYRISFNNAIVRAMHYRVDFATFFSNNALAHNVVLYGIKTKMAKHR